MKRMRCELCHRSMEEVEYRLVPEEDMQFAVRMNHTDECLQQGWFWCAECNDWAHQPTVEMVHDIFKGLIK